MSRRDKVAYKPLANINRVLCIVLLVRLTKAGKIRWKLIFISLFRRSVATLRISIYNQKQRKAKTWYVV